jgi:glycosyltransferase involved in cell wall biosynthesis
MQIHILSFEGPDEYTRAGGIASRVTGLAEALADSGSDTHLWFVGDPHLAGHETRDGVDLHRWCQWISSYHPGGVYDGEEGKRTDLASSLPLFLLQEELLPHLKETGRRAVVLAEEWHTVDAVLNLDGLLRRAGLRHLVDIFWNANNTFGFHRVDWRRLAQAAVITTVSRYMRYQMWSLGVDPLVIPNGLSPDSLRQPERETITDFRNRLRGRTVLGKVARWDPDKRWLLAIDTVGELKRYGKRPLLIARGGVEAHRHEVLAKAAGAGLRITERGNGAVDAQGLLLSVDGLEAFDIVCLKSHLEPSVRRVLFRGADAILANSGHEPFGLVGLETMAVGGLACTGGTGEDYVVPGWNALVLQSTDPREFVSLSQHLESNPPEKRAIRQNARYTANQHTWQLIIQRNLLPRLGFPDDEVLSTTCGVPLRHPSDEGRECKAIGLMNSYGGSRTSSRAVFKCPSTLSASREVLLGPGQARQPPLARGQHDG